MKGKWRISASSIDPDWAMWIWTTEKGNELGIETSLQVDAEWLGRQFKRFARERSPVGYKWLQMLGRL